MKKIFNYIKARLNGISRKTLKNVDAFAKKEGFQLSFYLDKWNDFLCFEPIMDKKKPCVIGLQLILVEKNGNIRMATYEEANEHMGR